MLLNCIFVRFLSTHGLTFASSSTKCGELVAAEVMMHSMLAFLCVSASKAKQPHLLYLLADDYGWANVGFHATDMHTPQIDRLATQEGFELSRLYAYRFCSPTRSSIMTGRLPYHVNQQNNAKWGWTAPSVSQAMTLLPQKLQEAGYYTVQAGKWHLGLAKQTFTPVGRGFNESLTMLMGSEHHFTQHNGIPAASHVDLWASDRPALGKNGTYSATLFGTYAEQALARHAAARPNQPLFMYLAYTVTHSPDEAPKRYTNQYPKDWIAGRRVYAGMASALDESVGNITAALKRLGMWENTLLVFSSESVRGHLTLLALLALPALCCPLLTHCVCVLPPDAGTEQQWWAIARGRRFKR